MLLEVNRLSVSYGSIIAVDNVSFSVDAGRIVAIIGANGAGKSTILRSVSGLKSPASGSIFFKGRDITGIAPHLIVKKGIAHVPEGRGIFAPLTVMENLEVAASAGQSAAAVSKALTHVFELFPRLKERRAQIAGTLSGGEQQMLAVGRALVTGGELLLLDEPSMGLAPALVQDMFETIVRINREGTTILLVEQNAAKALSIAHTAYVLETGSIVLSGKAAEIRDNPKVREAYLGG
ncbi:MAG TPA: ABC transporter ATP-binding protein [Chitinivibrionales bacterium]|nr:ABC transporter ATP-binding protein [Chitinivibrionales bacterium]